MREKLEPILQRSKPALVKKLGLRKLSMGSEPPQILAIRLFRQVPDKSKVS
jgi:hypothetical protein